MNNIQNDNLEQWAELDCDAVDFDALESKLESDLEQQMSDLKGLEIERDKIGEPDSIGKVVEDVVWEQIFNQIGVEAGKDFIEKNRGLTLNLSDKAHIQNSGTFEDGIIATHNYISREALEHNYDRYKNTPHSEFRKEFVNPGMDEVLPRAGELNKQGVESVPDIYTGRQIPTNTKLEDGSNNPKAAQREHVIPSAEVYKNATLQMAYSDEELAEITNNPDNLQGYTTAERNNRKSDNSADEMEGRDKNKHWEKANQKAEKHINEKEKEGRDRLETEGRQTQKEEALRIGGDALRAAVMGLLASLLKEIIRKLIAWFRSSNKKFSTFIDSIKDAIKSFVSNIKEHLLNAGNSLITTIATAIFKPVVGVIKKAWIFLKQGYKSIKEAIEYLKNPENKNKPFCDKMLRVGKIVIGGLTAGGAIVLGEVIEKGLLTVFPAFAIQIPLLGSLASLVGMFLGAIVSGLIGALALNLIDRLIAKRLKRENEEKQFDKRNGILQTQRQLIEVSSVKVAETKRQVATNIAQRHSDAVAQYNDMHLSANQALENAEMLHKESIDLHNESDDLHNSISNANGDINNLLKNL